MSCPGDDELAAFVAGGCTPAQRRSITEHVDQCEACQLALSVAEGISRHEVTTEHTAVSLPKGTTVGRFLVVQPVGRGAMGQVYSAYDPALDRRVALKFLHAQAPGDLQHPRALRLLREARALATVAHPNVVTVHDLGVFDGHPYVAMEYVEGTTLGGWLAARPRTSREILDAYRAAGAGLIAAHARGLVHRDFKPDNVLVGTDGRVCVTDFGLVRWARADEGDGDAPPPGVATDTAQTQAGALVGTPAYMSPEQLRGGVADARSDQFSYCVAVWEALTGERPFAGRTPVERLNAIEAGRPKGEGLPREVAAALQRGLANDPDARHESMERLLARLQTTRRNLGWIAAGALAAAAGGVGFVAASPAVLDSAKPGFCSTVTDRIAAVWGPTQRDGLAEALRQPDAAHLEPTVRSVLGRIDAYTASWEDSVAAQCRAETEGTVATSVSAVRMACLQRRLGSAEALVVALTDAGPSALDRAVEAADKLPSLSACMSDAAGAGRVGLEDATIPHEEVARIEADLLQATTQMNLGWLDVAATTAGRVVEAARTVGHKGLLTDALDVHGRVLLAQGKLDDSLAVFEEATVSAVAARYHRAAYTALANRAYVLGGRRNEADRAAELLELARAELRAAGGDAQLEINSLSVAATIETRRGDYLAAVDLYREVIAKREALDGRSSRARGIDYANLGTALRILGRTEEGVAALQEAERALMETHGPRHRTLIGIRGSLLSARVAKGPDAETVVLARQAVADATAVLGDDNEQVGILLATLSRAQLLMGDSEGALASSRRALEVFAPALGDAHPNVLAERVMIAAVLRSVDRNDEAEAQIDRVIEVARGESGLRRQLAEALQVRSSISSDRGDHSVALAADDEALAVFIELLGADSTAAATARYARGLTLLNLERSDEGIVELDAARTTMLAQLEAGSADPVEVGLLEARLAMAISTAPSHNDDTAQRVAGLVDSARSHLDGAPQQRLAEDEGARWLQTQPASGGVAARPEGDPAPAAD